MRTIRIRIKKGDERRRGGGDVFVLERGGGQEGGDRGDSRGRVSKGGTERDTHIEEERDRESRVSLVQFGSCMRQIFRCRDNGVAYVRQRQP